MKKQPVRQCVSCKTRKDKRELIRVVEGPDGMLVADPTGRMPGRGAYLCKNKECIETELRKAARLSKGLRRNITAEEAAKLSEEILKQADE